MVAALVLTTGAHWAALQTVAWTTMLANNLCTQSVSEAVSHTFDGEHLCPLCRAIAVDTSLLTPPPPGPTTTTPIPADPTPETATPSEDPEVERWVVGPNSGLYRVTPALDPSVYQGMPKPV